MICVFVLSLAEFLLIQEKNSVENKLEEWLRNAEKVVIAGIGNPIRKDDFVGVRVIQKLRGKTSEKVLLLECETVPESFLPTIVDFDPTQVLLIDAAILGLTPGEMRLIVQDQLADFPATSTHMLPLRIFCDYLTATTKSKIALLLIEPENVEFGEGLTPELEKVAEKIAEVISRLLS